VVSVWQNYPTEGAAAAESAAEAPAEAPAEQPGQAETASATARGTASRAAKMTSSQPVATPPPASRVDARLLVVHKHRFGECQGTLRAVPGTLTYATEHQEDAFRLAFAEVEALDLDAGKKNLRIRRKGGKTWNFTTRGDAGPALTTFHKEAERARK
jgi:hypothetical protein